MDEYYRLWFDDEIPDPVILYDKDLCGVNRYHVFDGQWVEDWPQNVTFLAKGKNPKDYLTGGGNNWIIVSRRVQQAVAACNVKGIQFLPVTVEHQSGVKLPGCALMKVIQIVSALDVENTIWMTPEGKLVKHPSLSIVKVALKRTAICGLDIFRISESLVGIYVSSSLVQCLVDANATVGFRFEPVVTT